jgi:hypothetical protein
VLTYEIEFYEDENGDEPVGRWLRKRSDMSLLKSNEEESRKAA